MSQHERKQIKVFLSPDDQDRLRLAAALRRTTMAGFCREVILTEVTQVTKGVEMPAREASEQ